MSPPSGENAYVTLLTRPSYLAGALLLAYTLAKHSPSTPLIITYTPSTFPESCVHALQFEAQHSNIILHPVEHLRLPDDEDNTEHGMVAERFIDTWTKLRVFDLHTLPQKFQRMCWLDADMMVFSDPSPLIFNAENDAYIRGGADSGCRLMAVHTCVCNLDHDSWAPESWTPANCALTNLTSPSDIPSVSNDPPTFSLFNSGTFLFHPSPELSSFVHNAFEEAGSKALRAMQFPDQDFLNRAFHDRWSSLSWKTNALKTWRYWHPNFWKSDKDVAVLHYIVDKPWVKRVGPDGRAGYKGDDGATHRWWWDEFDRWHSEREAQSEKELLRTVGKYVAGETEDENEELRAIGGGAQEYAKKWESKKDAVGQEGAGDASAEDEGVEEDGPHGPVLRKKMLGERGHGPVVRGGGIGRGGRGRGEGWCVMDA